MLTKNSTKSRHLSPDDFCRQNLVSLFQPISLRDNKLPNNPTTHRQTLRPHFIIPKITLLRSLIKVYTAPCKGYCVYRTRTQTRTRTNKGNAQIMMKNERRLIPLKSTRQRRHHHHTTAVFITKKEQGRSAKGAARRADFLRKCTPTDDGLGIPNSSDFLSCLTTCGASSSRGRRRKKNQKKTETRGGFSLRIFLVLSLQVHNTRKKYTKIYFQCHIKAFYYLRLCHA